MKYAPVNILWLMFFFTTCKGQAKKDLPKEKEHPKLIINIGNPKYGNVQCSLLDKDGNFWFGTTLNGLYKYDGKTLQQFIVADGKSFTRFTKKDGLSDRINIKNNIICIFEDKEGKIWIGTEAGLFLYDGKTFSEFQIPLPKNWPPNTYHNSRDVFSIIQDKSGKLWFATIDGIFIYDGKSFTPFTVSEKVGGFKSSNNHNVEKIFEDKEGNIWFGGRAIEGVYRYDGKSVTKLKLQDLYQEGPTPRPNNWAWPQLQDKNGNIWFSNWAGVYRYDGKSFTTFTKKEGLSDNMVAIITEDKKGNLWFGGGGLTRYDGKSFTSLTANEGLPNLGIWSILEDKTGNLWIGTRENGLFFYDGKTFISYSGYKQ